jgi:nucleotide-binding universal stress UspA family protein
MKTILVPVDFSDVTQKVVATARKFVEAFGSRIVLLHVVEPEPDFVGFEPGPVSVRAVVAEDFRHEHQRLEELKKSLAGLDVLALQVQGSTAEKILRAAEEHHAELIIMGSHGHGALYHLLVGGVANGVLKSAACPVLIVPSERKSEDAAA